ncbi:HlyD family efflux transporter periplasmic adaptor subunit [candidate division KSB1 bacterium]|nr:HlyD family efflux transporter periplasmic adaptor subunit [candidate division KSB1 bacterium]
MRLKKIRQTHNFNLYILLWFVALVVVLYLAQDWLINKKFIGIVESKSHQPGARESGRISSVLVAVGGQVKKEQVLAILDVSDLKATLDQLQNELANFQRLKRAQHRRSSILVQRMALQLENEAANLIDRFSLLESKTTELAGLNAEIERAQAEQAGLGYSRDLSDLILQRDALASYLKSQREELALQSRELENARRSRESLTEAGIDSMTESLVLDQMEYAESLRRQVAETEYRLNMRSVIAPCGGYVTEIFARPGDVVDAFVPILAVEESKPSFIDVYVPEHSRLKLEPGMKVEIFSSRNDHSKTTAIITFVHPGFTQASERLSFRGQMFWARKVRAELAEEHDLIPGEVAAVRILKKDNDERNAFLSLFAFEKSTSESDCFQMKKPVLRKMSVSAELWEKTRFEPSGIVWLPDVEKYLIVSDDTGIQGTQSEHAPWVFLMDQNGQVESKPVSLKGIDAVNDLEAITPAGNGIFYLVSSQNISKKNTRQCERQLIIKVEQEGNQYVVRGQVQLLSLLLRSYTGQELGDLGLEQLEADGLPVLNIEGVAFHDRALFLALKEPVSSQGAIIWKIVDVENIFNTQALAPNQVSVYGYVQSGRDRNEIAGLSDLMFDQDGKLWALSSIVRADGSERFGGFYRINHFVDGRLEATRICSFPELKPEGICLKGAKRFMIVFDRDNENPQFCYIDAEGL